MNFDLHTHPSLKTMLGGTNNTERNDCWSNINALKAIDMLIGGIIGSQSSLKQLKNGEVKIAVAALYSLEQAFAQNWLLTDVVTTLTKRLSKKYLESIANNQLSPYQNLKDELEHLRNSQAKGMKIINTSFDLDFDKINLILAVEGLHCFQDTYNMNDKENIDSIEKNLQEFLSLNRVLYLGLVHLTRNPICTQSYAMKLIKDSNFYPDGGGLTTDAKRFIDICYEGKHGKKTFIDIKHMGIASRIQFYEYRTQKGYENIPIIASHAAITGRSFGNIKIISSNKKNKIYEVTHSNSFSPIEYSIDPSPSVEIDFNPWSLNLYDEEIIKIIDSGGLIGLILDDRVLGGTIGVSENPVEGSEFFSVGTYNYLVGCNKMKIEVKDINNDKQTIFSTNITEILGTENIKAGMQLFATIFHIVSTYHEKYNNYNAWDHICIGSDSDGLIKTISSYSDESDMNTLRDLMLRLFKNIRTNTQTIDKVTKKINKDPEKNISKYFPDNVENLIEKIFYQNGKNFIDNYL